MNKTKNTKRLEKEITALNCEVERLKAVHKEYLRLHNDIPEQIANVLRRMKSLYTTTQKDT